MMSFIKDKWFLILNILIFGGSVALYFTSVAGQAEKKAKEEKAVDVATRGLKNLAKDKPTAAWNESLEKTQASIGKHKGHIYRELGAADNLIHRYFDVVNPEQITTEAPDQNNYLVYKSNLVKKWNELQKKYCQFPLDKKPGGSKPNFPGGFPGGMPPEEFFPEEFMDDPSFGRASVPSAVRSSVLPEEEKVEIKHFRCQPQVISFLEPKWLRNEDVPETEQEFLDAMKNYWITVEVLRVFEKIDIETLLKMDISEPMQTDSYKLKDNMFWGYREITASVEIEVGKTPKLWDEFHASPYLFRLVGFDQINIMDAPGGVESDAPHITFDDLKERQRLTINLWHFDYLQKGETLAADGAATPSGTPRGSTRARGRRGR